MSATTPLRTFVQKANTYLATGSKDISSQEWGTPQMIRTAHDEFKSTAAQKVEEWKARLMVYLGDEETVKVLVPPAQVCWLRDYRRDAEEQNSIVDAYRQFHDLIRAETDFSTAASMMTPSAVLTLLRTPATVANGQA